MDGSALLNQILHADISLLARWVSSADSRTFSENERQILFERVLDLIGSSFETLSLSNSSEIFTALPALLSVCTNEQLQSLQLITFRKFFVEHEKSSSISFADGCEKEAAQTRLRPVRHFISVSEALVGSLKCIDSSTGDKGVTISTGNELLTEIEQFGERYDVLTATLDDKNIVRVNSLIVSLLSCYDSNSKTKTKLNEIERSFVVKLVEADDIYRFALNVSSSCSLLEKNYTTMLLSDRHWRKMQRALVHIDSATCKRIAFALQRFQSVTCKTSVEAHSYSKLCPLASYDGSSHTQAQRSRQGFSVAAFWNDFWIAYEVLNEPQYHLIEPVLRRFQLSIDRFFEAFRELEYTSIKVDPSWLVTLFEHGFRHINATIQRWSAENTLRIPAHVLDSLDGDYLRTEFLETVIKMFNTTHFYAPLLRVDSDSDKLRLKPETKYDEHSDFYLIVPISFSLNSFFDNLLLRVAKFETVEERTLQLRNIIQLLFRSEVNEAALFFALRALCKAEQNQCIEKIVFRCLDTADVRKIIVECRQILKQCDVPIRCALAQMIARVMFQHMHLTSLALSDFCNLLAFLHNAERGVLWSSSALSARNKRPCAKRGAETLVLCRKFLFESDDAAVQRIVTSWLIEARGRLFCEATYRDAQFAEDTQFIDGCAIFLTCFYDAADPKAPTMDRIPFERESLPAMAIDNALLNAERAYMNVNAHINAVEFTLALFHLGLNRDDDQNPPSLEFALATAIETAFVSKVGAHVTACLKRISQAASSGQLIDLERRLFSLLNECAIRRRQTATLTSAFDYIEQARRESLNRTALIRLTGFYLHEFDKFASHNLVPESTRLRTREHLDIVTYCINNIDNVGVLDNVDFFSCISHLLGEEPLVGNDLLQQHCRKLLDACVSIVECQTEFLALCVGIRCFQRLVRLCYEMHEDGEFLLGTVRSVYNRLKREEYSSTREYREVLLYFFESLFSNHLTNQQLMQVATEISADYSELGCVYPGMMHDPLVVVLNLYQLRPTETIGLLKDNFIDFLADCCMFGPLRNRGMHDACALAEYLEMLPDLSSTATSYGSDTGLLHNDAIVRVDAVLLLASLRLTSDAETALAVSVFDRLLFVHEVNLSRGKSGAGNIQRTSYFNTHYHRTRYRLIAALLVLHEHVALGGGELLTRVLKRCFDLLPEERFSNVRNLVEWLVVMLYCKSNSETHRSYVAALVRDSLSLAVERPSFTCSVFSLLIQFCKVLDCDSLSTLLDYALPAAFEQIFVSQNYTVRLHAAYFLKLCAHRFTTSKQKESVAAPSQACQFARKYAALFEVLEQSHVVRSEAYKKHIGKMESSFWVTQFDPFADFSLETLYFDQLRLTDMIQTELIHPTMFAKRFGSLVRNSGTLVCPVENMRPVLRSSSRAFQWRFKEDEINEEAFANEIDLLSSTQKKIIPNPDGELGCAKTSKTNLIVVASLIDKAPNLGGLCRTCEIFAARELVIHTRNVLQDAEFRALSVSADQWITLTEVRVRDLRDYLDKMRREHGYTVIAVEQTANSNQLESFRFPVKSLLLLGHEKTGVPADLLNLVDACVEIPQAGIIRSLNVHVTGAIVIWEYFKQHSRSNDFKLA